MGLEKGGVVRRPGRWEQGDMGSPEKIQIRKVHVKDENEVVSDPWLPTTPGTAKADYEYTHRIYYLQMIFPLVYIKFMASSLLHRVNQYDRVAVADRVTGGLTTR